MKSLVTVVIATLVTAVVVTMSFGSASARLSASAPGDPVKALWALSDGCNSCVSAKGCDLQERACKQSCENRYSAKDRAKDLSECYASCSKSGTECYRNAQESCKMFCK